ncbi:hypothetical protein KJ764_05985 [Patescibacteria group bacterium]|nr:hypothetical protein [Patescibacteria group bacterium]
MQHIFHLGRETKLCLTEILTFYPEAKDLGGFALVKNADPKILKRLGGTIKISEVKQELPASLPVNFTELIFNELKKNIPNSGKFQYGLSIHPSRTGLLKKILKELKPKLKQEKISSRYLNQDGKNLSSIQSANCTELNLIFTNEKTYLSHTVATQNIAAYSKRDYERPARDDMSGMLPPKLAQIMINLAQPEELVYDPFCGSGTILQEALLMGFQAKGSDLSEKAISDSQKNLKWIGKECPLEIKDATEIDSYPKNCTIVAESYLGPPQKGFPTPEEAKAALAKLEPLYLDFLKTPIPSGTKVVLALPFFNLQNNPIFLENFIEKAKELGYSVPAEEAPLTYARKKQVIGRMIISLRKK